MGNKSKTGALQGMDKVRQVSEHVNLILKYIPYVQTNFVLGLDSDEGDEPFELTKRFLDLTPGAFPGYSLLTAFGRAAALNLDYQRANRVLPFPFHFLNNNQAMNVKPRNYEWQSFLRARDRSDALFVLRPGYCVAAFAQPRDDVAVDEPVEGGLDGRVWQAEILSGKSARGWIPTGSSRLTSSRRATNSRSSMSDLVRKDLGPLWEWLPEGGLNHDPYAYLKSERSATTLVSAPLNPSRAAVRPS